MDMDIKQSAPLNIRPAREKYGWTFILSIAIHTAVILLVIFGGLFFPMHEIVIGSGLGGGIGGDSYTVGTVEELSGGVGMTKPAVLSKPPALIEKEPPAINPKAIPLPESNEPKKRKLTEKEIKQALKGRTGSNLIPTAPEPGSGGPGGSSSGAGGGSGGGNGVFIGAGSGGFGSPLLDSYARDVEYRISKSWSKPEGRRVEMTYSFYIEPDGSIRNVKLEQSSGDSLIDAMASSAINSLSYPRLTPPPGGRLIKFVAKFIYPPKQ
jgi:outer membrane biosynthesis protein TonB